MPLPSSSALDAGPAQRRPGGAYAASESSLTSGESVLRATPATPALTLATASPMSPPESPFGALVDPTDAGAMPSRFDAAMTSSDGYRPNSRRIASADGVPRDVGPLVRSTKQGVSGSSFNSAVSSSQSDTQTATAVIAESASTHTVSASQAGASFNGRADSTFSDPAISHALPNASVCDGLGGDTTVQGRRGTMVLPNAMEAFRTPQGLSELFEGVSRAHAAQDPAQARDTRVTHARSPGLTPAVQARSSQPIWKQSDIARSLVR